MVRGFAALGVRNPKYNGNVGGLLRAASCYGAALVVLESTPPKQRGRIECTDQPVTHRHVPVLWTTDLFSVVPHEAVLIAIELIPGATALPDFVHPASAFYLFGNEGETLGADVLQRCRHVVSVPTECCMNLAATANVVLYDRQAKRQLKNMSRHYTPISGLS